MNLNFYGKLKDKKFEIGHCETAGNLLAVLTEKLEDEYILLINGKTVPAIGGVATVLQATDKIDVMPVMEAG